MGEVIRGTLMMRATLTATTTGTALNLGEIEDGESFYADIHVGTPSVSDTVTITIESDTAEAFTTPTTRGTSQVFSARGAQRLQIAGPVEESWWRAKATIAGTTVSIPVSVSMGLGGQAVAVQADVHDALVTALGGSANVAALYVTKDGETGAASDTVSHGSGVVEEWGDYLGVAPSIVFSGTARPAWDGALMTLTADGVDDWGETAASAGFDISGAKAIVVVSNFVSGAYVASINSSGGITRFMGLSGQFTFWRMEITSSLSNVWTAATNANTTRRVNIGSKDGTTGAKHVVPDDSQASASVTASGSGNNVLTLFRRDSAHSTFTSAVVCAVIVLNIDPDSTQRDAIRDWAITNFGAVAA